MFWNQCSGGNSVLCYSRILVIWILRGSKKIFVSAEIHVTKRLACVRIYRFSRPQQHNRLLWLIASSFSVIILVLMNMSCVHACPIQGQKVQCPVTAPSQFWYTCVHDTSVLWWPKRFTHDTPRPRNLRTTVLCYYFLFTVKLWLCLQNWPQVNHLSW